jgi:hypothetical protein
MRVLATQTHPHTRIITQITGAEFECSSFYSFVLLCSFAASIFCEKLVQEKEDGESFFFHKLRDQFCHFFRFVTLKQSYGEHSKQQPEIYSLHFSILFHRANKLFHHYQVKCIVYVKVVNEGICKPVMYP